MVSSGVNVFLSSGGDPPPSEGLLEPVVKFLTLITGFPALAPVSQGEQGQQPTAKKRTLVKSKTNLTRSWNVIDSWCPWEKKRG